MRVRALPGAVFLTAIAVIAPLLAAPQQQPAPSATFQVQVDFVDIDAVVTDERGNFVAGLTKDDFELLDDGKPQEISAFSLVDIPVPSAAANARAVPPAISDVKSNAEPISGRLYVIVLDDLNVAPLRTKVVVNSARELIERHFGPNDIAAITYTSGRTDGAQEFTSERAALLAAIDKFQGRKLRSTVIEKADQYFQQHLKELEVNQPNPDDPDAGPPQSGTIRGPNGYSDITTDPDDFERGHRAQQVLGELKRLAEVMGGIRGRRKAIVMFSEGIDYPIYDIFGSQAATTVMTATRDAIAAAARANVSFFSIDPRGLVGMTSETIELNYAADAHLGFDARGLLADMYLSQDSLRTLAEETGGYAAVNSNNVTTALNRIVRLNSMYYVLGYYPKDARHDGRFHKIEVRAKRPGLRVSARKGYVSPRPLSAEDRSRQERERERGRTRVGDTQSSNDLREILNQPLQRNGLTLTVQAAPFKGAAKQASVAVAIEVDAAQLHFSEQPNKTFADVLELSLFALDERGRQQGGSFYQFNLTLRPDTYERVRGSIVRMNPRMALPPGRYQLRIGARETGAGEMGSVFYDLQVPDYNSRGLAMSGLLLTDGAARTQFTAQPDDQIPPGTLPAPSTSRRVFGQADVLSLFAEIYDTNSSRDARRIEVIATLVGEDGVAAFSSRESLAGGSADVQSSRIPVAKQIPLKDVRPGRYVLRVEARLLGGGATPVARETPVTITQ
ncbi:MAG TPA: VWA domain-containing protein [Vicinamibacterales bacterium]